MSNTTSCCCLLFLSFHYNSAVAAREEFTIFTAAKVDRNASSLQQKTKAQHLAAAILGIRRQTLDGLQEKGQGSRYDRYSGSSYQSEDHTENHEGYEEIQDDSSSSSSVGVPPPITGQLRVIRGNTFLPWLIPVLGCFVSYKSFGQVSKLFLRLVQWASSNTWIPQTREDIDLQASVVVSSCLACLLLPLQDNLVDHQPLTLPDR
jgi:hypothetical protein